MELALCYWHRHRDCSRKDSGRKGFVRTDSMADRKEYYLAEGHHKDCLEELRMDYPKVLRKGWPVALRMG